MNPLDFRGPVFLQFYALCFVVAVVVAFVLRSILRRAADDNSDLKTQLHPIELALLAGGHWRALQVAVVSLVQRQQIHLGKGGTIRAEEGAAIDLKAPPLEGAIRHAANMKGITFPYLRRYCHSVLLEMDERLAAEGLLLSQGSRLIANVLSVLILGMVMIMGLAKVAVGISRDKPVGFLIFGLILSLIILIVIVAYPPRRTPKGDRLLRSRQLSSSRASQSRSPGDFDTSLMLAVALVGTDALAGTEWSSLRGPLMDRHIHQSSDWGSSHSCGSSCGGASCGGGGGGGCGGCGGS